MKDKDIYDARLAALAVNFSEQIYDSYEPGEEQHKKMLFEALAKMGYDNLSESKLNITLEYYLTQSEEDIHSLPEYSMEIP